MCHSASSVQAHRSRHGLLQWLQLHRRLQLPLPLPPLPDSETTLAPLLQPLQLLMTTVPLPTRMQT